MGLAIEAFGQNTSDGGFAHTAHAGKQIGMMQAIGIECITQRPQYRFLTQHVTKMLGSPFTRKNLVAHSICELQNIIIGWHSAPAASRHPNPLLPLLPSGPDGVNSFSSRECRYGTP